MARASQAVVSFVSTISYYYYFAVRHPAPALRARYMRAVCPGSRGAARALCPCPLRASRPCAAPLLVRSKPAPRRAAPAPTLAAMPSRTALVSALNELGPPVLALGALVRQGPRRCRRCCSAAALCRGLTRAAAAPPWA
jgi:hypothetical protein